MPSRRWRTIDRSTRSIDRKFKNSLKSIITLIDVLWRSQNDWVWLMECGDSFFHSAHAIHRPWHSENWWKTKYIFYFRKMNELSVFLVGRPRTLSKWPVILGEIAGGNRPYRQQRRHNSTVLFAFGSVHRMNSHMICLLFLGKFMVIFCLFSRSRRLSCDWNWMTAS